jgi:hypothetical protein
MLSDMLMCQFYLITKQTVVVWRLYIPCNEAEMMKHGVSERDIPQGSGDVEECDRLSVEGFRGVLPLEGRYFISRARSSREGGKMYGSSAGQAVMKAPL